MTDTVNKLKAQILKAEQHLVDTTRQAFLLLDRVKVARRELAALEVELERAERATLRTPTNTPEKVEGGCSDVG